MRDQGRYAVEGDMQCGKIIRMKVREHEGGGGKNVVMSVILNYISRIMRRFGAEWLKSPRASDYKPCM